LANVLIITYLFPPSGGVAPPRSVAYTRYLPDYGCRVSVLTARNPATPLYDPALSKLVPPETKVHRAFNPEVSYKFRDKIWKKIAGGNGRMGGIQADRAGFTAARRLASGIIGRVFCPDVQRVWVPFALARARRILRQERIDTVILTTPPFSLHALIPPLKREFPHVKWITEVRDDWVGYHLENFDTALNDYKRRVAIDMEGAGMRASDYVVAVTSAQTLAIASRYPDQPPKKFLCVPNGYDPEIFEGFKPRRGNRQRMTIKYFGTLYASPPYSPLGFLEALDSIPPEVLDQVDVQFIGRIPVEVAPLLEGRRAHIQSLGFFPKAEGIRLLEDSDYLLLIVNDPTAHAGKLFDYLATGIPILALTPPGGEIARIIQETRSGAVADGRDSQAIRALLMDAFRQWRQRASLPTPDWDAIRAYERRNLVKRLVDLTGIGAAANLKASL
jgi:glycosyltransferase involved in cell wall biosynthesis